MLFIPAIDLKNKKCVRLKQGNFNKITIFSNNPVKTALYWIKQRIKRLHIIDLDGAFYGKPINILSIESILNIIKKKKINVKIQLGGGIRKFKDIEFYLNKGISYIILGTKAIKNIFFFKKACIFFPKKILISLDVKKKYIAINGWTKKSNIKLLYFIKKIKNYKCKSIIYTDISKDGMMNGINLYNTLKLTKYTNINIIASGGIKNFKNIKYINKKNNKNIKGVICGRSIYEGSLNIKLTNKLFNI